MCQINIKHYNQICAVLLDDGKMLMNACDKHILVTANLTQCHTVTCIVLFHSIIRCSSTYSRHFNIRARD